MHLARAQEDTSHTRVQVGVPRQQHLEMTVVNQQHPLKYATAQLNTCSGLKGAHLNNVDRHVPG